MEHADLQNPLFTDEDAAWAHYETLRWPDGPICPKCGSVDNSVRVEAKPVTRTRKLKDGTTKTVTWKRRGVMRCKDCAEQFTATVGTIFEDSHIPMHKWLMGAHLICASKKGMSAAQFHRMLGFGSYRTAWFMLHRLREAMAERGSCVCFAIRRGSCRTRPIATPTLIYSRTEPRTPARIMILVA